MCTHRGGVTPNSGTTTQAMSTPAQAATIRQAAPAQQQAQQTAAQNVTPPPGTQQRFLTAQQIYRAFNGTTDTDTRAALQALDGTNGSGGGINLFGVIRTLQNAATAQGARSGQFSDAQVQRRIMRVLNQSNPGEYEFRDIVIGRFFGQNYSETRLFHR